MNRPVASPAPDFFSRDVAKARRFYLDLNPPKQRQLAVICGGLEHCTPGYAIHRETFPFFSIEYVARGKGRLRLNGEQHELHPGRLFAYSPGIAHDIRGSGTDRLVKYFVNFAGSGAPGLLQRCGLQSGQTACVYPADTLVALFDELIASGLRGGRDGNALATKLLECLALKIGGARAPLAGAETVAFSSYQNCRRHLEENFLRLRTLEQVAFECHTSVTYLCRLFRRYDDQSPYQYLLKLKMRHAAELLQRSDVLIKKVADETGFADPFHFSRVFRSVLGLSPAQFKALR